MIHCIIIDRFDMPHNKNHPLKWIACGIVRLTKLLTFFKCNIWRECNE
jgi:hypothetical protein